MAKKPINPTKTELDKLSPEALAFYKRLVREWRLRDGAGLTIALTAGQALDRLRGSQEILRRDGLTTTDRFGQTRMHPMIDAEQKARSGLLLALKSLNLDLESLEADE